MPITENVAVELAAAEPSDSWGVELRTSEPVLDLTCDQARELSAEIMRAVVAAERDRAAAEPYWAAKAQDDALEAEGRVF